MQGWQKMSNIRSKAPLMNQMKQMNLLEVDWAINLHCLPAANEKRANRQLIVSPRVLKQVHRSSFSSLRPIVTLSTTNLMNQMNINEGRGTVSAKLPCRKNNGEEHVIGCFLRFLMNLHSTSMFIKNIFEGDPDGHTHSFCKTCLAEHLPPLPGNQKQVQTQSRSGADAQNCGHVGGRNEGRQTMICRAGRFSAQRAGYYRWGRGRWRDER